MSVNITFYRQLSFWLSLTTITVLGSGLSAQAETSASNGTESSPMGILTSAENFVPIQESVSPTSAPIPGTTATLANVLASQTTSAPTVAQADSAPAPSPSSEPAPATPAPAQAPTTPTASFSDVDPNYWAQPFIQGLTTAGVIAGFPDGTFRPEQPVNRAQFAAMLQKAFSTQSAVRQLPVNGFTDVPADYWAAPAIARAYEIGFLAGYPDNTFAPNQQIPKVQAIAGLATGLQLLPSGTVEDVVSTAYADSGQIPTYALDGVAAATQNNLVVNYPDVRTLNPLVPLTRAEAAAHLYQALVKLGQAAPLPSTVAAANYIVGGPGGVAQAPPTSPAPTETPTETETAPTATAAAGIGSYIGAGINIGVLGNDTALGDTNFTLFSKFRLLRALPVSLRPAVVIGDNTTFLVPVTFDIPLGATNIPIVSRFPIYPYLGGGIIIPTGDGGDVGPLVSAGFDYRLSSQFTATAGVNVGWSSGDVQLGVLLGIGYNFNTGFAGF